MSRRPSSRKNRNQPAFLAAAGAGLILIGLALILLLNRSQTDPSFPPAANEWSVVPARVNFPAPDLSLTSIDGRAESLADFRTQVVLVNNWATWCPPCKAEMPTLEAFYESHAAEGLQIIAVEAGDPQPSVLKFAQSQGLQFHVWVDRQTLSLAAFRNQNLPNSYVIDRTGTVRYTWTGAIDRGMLEKYVTPLLTQ